jgi:hypothetical protein
MAFIVATKPTPAFSIGGPGPVSGGGTGSTDNAVARWDGATGLQIQNSGVIIDDSNNVTGIASLTVTTLIATSTITTGDNMIVLNDDVVGAPTEDAGIEVNRGSSTDAQLLWNETTDKWTAGLSGALDSLATSSSSSSTDNTLPRFDGTSGIKIQTSSIVVDDSDNLSGAASLAATGDVSGATHTFSGTGGYKLSSLTYSSLPAIMLGDVNNVSNHGALISPINLYVVSRFGTGTNFTVYNRLSAGSFDFHASQPIHWWSGAITSSSTAVRMRYASGNSLSIDSGSLGSAGFIGPVATGSNSAANNLVIGPGVSTGNATPGSIIFQGTVAGASGSSSQTLATIATVGNGKISMNNASIEFPFAGGYGLTSAGGAPASLLVNNNYLLGTGLLGNILLWGSLITSTTNPIDVGNAGQHGFGLTYFGDRTVALKQNGSGILEINNGTTSTLRDLSLRSVAATKDIRPASQADADASNNSIYYSTDAAKLVYKDGAGVVNALY